MHQDTHRPDSHRGCTGAMSTKAAKTTSLRRAQRRSGGGARIKAPGPEEALGAEPVMVEHDGRERWQRVELDGRVRAEAWGI